MIRPQRIAAEVFEGFRTYRNHFDRLTRTAPARFRAAAWLDVQQASIERIECYPEAVTAVVERLTAESVPDIATWRASRGHYVELCRDLPDRELAETFFNSIYCRLWRHADIRDENVFVHPAVADRPRAGILPLHRHDLPTDGDFGHLIGRILADPDFGLPWQNLERDIGYICRALDEELPPSVRDAGDISVEMLAPAFYRNKAAYLVGRLHTPGRLTPLVIAVLNDEAGHVYVDNVVLEEDELSIIFSFTRSYFMVDTEAPSQVVDFLQTLLPAKKRFELYNTFGLNRHGKTELYRDLIAHLDDSDDRFVTAPGIRGMVMAVFTLPSYQTVFKIIKDRFPPQKDVTREQVMAAYRLVKMHDRVGRMADTQEFSNLRLPRDRFDSAVLDELLDVAASSVFIDGADVVIRHCYTERQMIPLNLYIEQAEEPAVVEALDEYGNAIRQLAAANIFPGDMLLKNFGVTRHGRVVFYDYDEICYLTDVNFRHIPEPRTPEEEMASEPWYTVGPNDVFPEEFPRFLFANRRIKQLFTRKHGEIFDPEYWRGLQQAIRDGQVMDVFPYRRSRRFPTRFRSTRNGPA